MRGGKEHAHQTQRPQPIVSDESPRASGSSQIPSITVPPVRANIPEPDISDSSNTQPTRQDVESGLPAETPSESNTGGFQDVLFDCNSLVEEYRKGEVSKVSVYVDIQSRLARALGDNRTRSDAAFGSFITTIESHDSEKEAAARRGGCTTQNQLQRSPSPPLSVSDGHQSDDEPASKRLKVDESVYAWIANRKGKRTVLRESLAKTLRLIEAYTIDPKSTKRRLENRPAPLGQAHPT